ncbi:MAG: hypothetical protein VKJ64_02370 [Leptolyngbyaceae bacterium]|nr:hypothetical protein [Leptolyngbyaceae bacterium]
METNQNLLTTQIEALREDLVAVRALQERQQESITSLIALSQQQTAVIEQQNAVINRLIGIGSNGSVPSSSRLVPTTEL